MKIRVADISGMDPKRERHGYEWGCQVVCLRALRFMERQKSGSEAPAYKTLHNVIGLAIPDGAAAKAMDEYILKHPALREYGMTGAMHQFGIAHAMKILELGRDGWLAEIAKDSEPGRFYEFEEDDAFPPEAEA